MKIKSTKISAIASGVALGIATMAATAADIPQLPVTGAQPGSIIRGGATLNGGASFQTEIPAGDSFDIVASISPASSDIGQTGSLVVVLEVSGVGQFILLSGGIWVPFTGDNVTSFKTKTLAATEEITIVSDFIGTDTNLTGATLSAYVGYYTGGNVGSITYSSTPATVTVAQPAPNTCPANTTSTTGTFKGKAVCVLTGRIESDTHLTSNFSYLLNGGVFIGSNTPSGTKTKLTVDPGTYVFGQVGLNFLVVDRNGQIFANGSREKPVIFTYEGDDTATAATTGQWGGLILNGNATLNVSGGTAEGEGSTGTYGGTNDADSSGSLTYVQVKYAGQNITEENELNGIAFQGTGSGTLVDFVQVHNNSDDGVEFYGGTTNAKHILLTGNEDDALDWTFGWSGKVQFVAMKQNSASEHCIEADSNSDNNDASPRANPTIANMTCSGPATGFDSGFRLREGTSAKLYNVVMTTFDYCVDIDQAATFANAGGSIAGLNGNLVMENSLLSSACVFEDESGDAFTVSGWYAAQANSAQGAVQLGGNSGVANSLSINAITPWNSSDSFFDTVDFIGAVKDDSSDWTAGWSFMQ